MSAYLVAFLTALLGWWLSTGVILYLNLLPRHSHRWSVLAFSTLGLFSLTLLPQVARDATPLGAAAGFAIVATTRLLIRGVFLVRENLR